MAKTYSATDIQVLEGLDAVRMRPGMYIGSTGARGLHHLIWEIVDNAIDEASNGFATEITVTLKKDGSCEVTDNGRGIPVDIHPQLGVSGVEVVYTQLHAGGKFNNKNYAYSGGLHGVGASVVNALSEWVTVDVYRDYSHYHIRFESYEDRKTGKIVSGHAVAPLEKVGNTRKRGTQVCFKPDPRVFEDTHFNGDTVRRRVRELAYLNQGVRFVFTDEREKDEARRRREYCYEGGLADFVQYLNTDKQTITGPITFEGRRDGTLLRVAIQYTDSYTENIYSFVNNVPTGEGGTHETGFKAAVTKAFNDYARRVGLLKEKDNNLSGEDFREGMTAVVYAGVQKPQFEGQTKGRLGNTEVRPIVEAICLEQLSLYLDDLKNQEVATRIVEKAVKAAKVREAARKAARRGAAEKPARGRAAGGQARPAAPAATGRRTSCSSSRAIPPAAAPSRAATGAFRPFCPCAASPSTPRKSASTRCWPTRSSAPSSPRWARASARSFDLIAPQVQPRHHPLGRRSGRRAHPRHPADLLLPLHARTGHRRPRLHRHAAALLREEGRGAHLLLRRKGAGEGHEEARPRLQRAALQGPGRNEPGTALGDHHEPQRPQDGAGHHRGPRRGRAPRHRADGRQGGAAPRVHSGIRQFQPRGRF